MDASHALTFTEILRGAGFCCRKASPSRTIAYEVERMAKMGKDDGESSSWEFAETGRLKGSDE